MRSVLFASAIHRQYTVGLLFRESAADHHLLKYLWCPAVFSAFVRRVAGKDYCRIAEIPCMYPGMDLAFLDTTFEAT